MLQQDLKGIYAKSKASFTEVRKVCMSFKSQNPLCAPPNSSFSPRLTTFPSLLSGDIKLPLEVALATAPNLRMQLIISSSLATLKTIRILLEIKEKWFHALYLSSEVILNAYFN